MNAIVLNPITVTTKENHAEIAKEFTGILFDITFLAENELSLRDAMQTRKIAVYNGLKHFYYGFLENHHMWVKQRGCDKVLIRVEF